jgi:hypothetical protein
MPSSLKRFTHIGVQTFVVRIYGYGVSRLGWRLWLDTRSE